MCVATRGVSSFTLFAFPFRSAVDKLAISQERKVYRSYKVGNHFLPKETVIGLIGRALQREEWNNGGGDGEQEG